MSADEIWYYALADGSAVGPLPRRKLQQLWRERTVRSDTLVWDSDSYDWRPLKKTVLVVGGDHELKLPAPPQRLDQAEQQTAKRSSNSKPSPAATEKAQRRAAVERSRAERSGKSRQLATVGSPPSFPGTSPIMGEAPAAAATGKADPAASDRAGWAGRRWVARLFDLCVSAPLALIVVLLILRAIEPAAAQQLLAWLAQPLLIFPVAMLAWIPFEALALSLFGTTPGKLLWGIGVGAAGGSRLGPASALQRSVSVVIRGLLLGIPPITLLSQGWAAVTYINQGSTSWDRASGAELSFAKLSGNQLLIALIATFACASAYLDGMTWELLMALYGQASGLF